MTTKMTAKDYVEQFPEVCAKVVSVVLHYVQLCEDTLLQNTPREWLKYRNKFVIVRLCKTLQNITIYRVI